MPPMPSPLQSRLCRLMDRSGAQLGLFGSLEGFPEGFSYEENILSLEEERTLVRAFAGLPLKAFEFQGFQGKRRVVSYGLHYDFNTRGLGSAEAIPEFMRGVSESIWLVMRAHEPPLDAARA